MMRHNNGKIFGSVALALICSAGMASAQNANPDVGKQAGTNRPANSNTRAQTNENETGAEPSVQELAGARKNVDQPQTLDTSKHLSDMSVDVIDTKMKLSAMQREQIQAILNRQKTQMQALVMSPDKQGEPDAVLAMQQQRAEVSRRTSRDIAMTLNSEQRNQIASLMTQEYNRALALQTKPGNGESSDQRMSQSQQVEPKRYHLHRQHRASHNAQP